MGTTAKRYRSTIVRRIRDVLGLWLQILPSAGWIGTVAALRDELESVRAAHRIACEIPRGAYLARLIETETATLAGCGVAVALDGAATATTLSFRRIAPAEEKAPSVAQ